PITDCKRVGWHYIAFGKIVAHESRTYVNQGPKNRCDFLPAAEVGLTIGHFDVEALKNRRLVVLRPLDMSIVTRLLQEVGQVGEHGRATLGGHAVEVKDGYIICPWLMAQRVLATEEFVRRLQQETGCVMYDAGRREIVTREQMAGW
ncbi:MAG: hypothetical protein HYS04_21715, partial [Acidobacteria bacterium]|nr:hypothetical protein [Acidobacteriota bacterium]